MNRDFVAEGGRRYPCARFDRDHDGIDIGKNSFHVVGFDRRGAIVLRHGSHVWVDSVWLPTISPTVARRALHEWLEVMPSDRLMWGAGCNHAEGIYGATVTTRRVLAEVLAEKVERGELLEEHALRIGRQILRDNALKLFPQLRGRLREGTEGRADGGRRPTAAQAGAR